LEKCLFRYNPNFIFQNIVATIDIRFTCLKRSELINKFLKTKIMLKNILNVDGAQQLSNNEQKEINGGLKIYRSCEEPTAICPDGKECVGFDSAGKIICR